MADNLLHSSSSGNPSASVPMCSLHCMTPLLLRGQMLPRHRVGESASGSDSCGLVRLRSLDFRNFARAHESQGVMNVLGPFGGTWHVSVLTLICVLLFTGAVGKSAQVPLHVWLPDAMEGPTPISALIHAATMVTAGVFMVARLAPLYNLSPTAMTVVAITGGITMVVGATIALTQTDIKRIVAYSTVSQLVYMIMACGLGA